MANKKIVPQTKAVLIAGEGVQVIRTDDGRYVALATDTAAKLAQQMLANLRPAEDIPGDTLYPERTGLVQ